MNPTLLNWLKETIERLQMESPLFFKWWRWISTAVLVFSGVPYALATLGINLPEPFATMSSKIATWCAVTALFMSSITVKTPPVAQTEKGEALKVTTGKKLPFTAKEEAKDVEEKVPEPPIISDEQIDKE